MEEMISELEDRTVDSYNQRRKKERKDERVKKVTSKRMNIHIIGILEGGEIKKKAGILFNEMTENSPNLGKDTDIQFQEVQKVPIKMTLKRLTPRHILIKLSKVKDRKVF